MLDIKKKLQEEIAALEYELRNELPREILKARAHGDLSENAEYHAAKERQGLVNARLGQLQKRLSDFSMIDMTKIPHDRVGLVARRGARCQSKDEKSPTIWSPAKRPTPTGQDLDRFPDRQVAAGQRGRRYREDAGAGRHERTGDSGTADHPRTREVELYDRHARHRPVLWPDHQCDRRRAGVIESTSERSDFHRTADQYLGRVSVCRRASSAGRASS